MKATSLNRATVVRGAVRLADHQGLASLTMRTLGQQLGVGAMALYRYVAGREALLDAMVADLLNGLALQLRAPASPAASGAALYLQSSAHTVRDLSLAHPWLVRLMVARPPPDPTLGPPPAVAACTDAVLAALTPHCTDRADSLRTYRAFCAFLLGHLLLETPPAAQAVRGPSPHAGATSRTAGADPAAEFDHSLQAFLDSINHTSHRPGAGPAATGSDHADHLRPGAPR